MKLFYCPASRILLLGLKIDFCIVSICNGCSSRFFNTTSFSIFGQNLQFFLPYLSLFWFFPPRGGGGGRKPPLGFDNKLLENFYRPLNSFQFFNITNFSNFFDKTYIFFKFFLNFFVIL